MSGGSMDYLYYRVEEANFKKNTLLRIAFSSHLKKVAEALKAIELVDSYDCSEGDEDGPILSVIQQGDMIEALTEEANRLSKNLNDVKFFLERVKNK